MTRRNGNMTHEQYMNMVKKYRETIEALEILAENRDMFSKGQYEEIENRLTIRRYELKKKIENEGSKSTR